MKCDWSYRHYLEILEDFIKNGYRFNFFNEAANEKTIYLRHDLDQSIEKAVLMADLERSVGAKATYCVRFASPFDNPFSRRNREALAKIISRGHQLALHFEREAWNGEIVEEAAKQLSILKQYLPFEDIVSFHRPQEDILNKHFKEFVNTYDKPFFSDVKYLSDSPGNWREGCICNHKKDISYQILTHPIWWGREEGDACRHLHDFMKEKVYDWDREIYDDNPFYTERIK